MDNDAFINALADVDILKVEAVSHVVGRAIGSLYKGMVERGMSEDAATRVIIAAIAEVSKVVRPSA